MDLDKSSVRTVCEYCIGGQKLRHEENDQVESDLTSDGDLLFHNYTTVVS